MANSPLPRVSHSEAWLQLQQHAQEMESVQLSHLFRQDHQRFSRYSLPLGKILFDYSKQRVSGRTIERLVVLAKHQRLEEKITQLLQGATMNQTEGRAALHTALRAPESAKVMLGGANVVAEVAQVRRQMSRFVAQVRSGGWRGFSGKRITDVVNIGVGGSDLGPKMVCRALQQYADEQVVKAHFISSIDGAHAADILPRLNPETTLFVVSSKTFTTADTMANAAAARSWLNAATEQPQALRLHFVAATVDTAAARRWGLPEENIFPFWEWVGGRYSMWSAIGLPIALYLGMERFEQLLHGAQLEMESLGKSVTQQGEKVDYQTGPIVWGGVGSNAQHAFYQLLHQGTRSAPMDFILPIDPAAADAEQYQLTIANCLAQSRAFMVGQESDDPHRLHQGNRPSTTLLMDRLDAESLGMLIALYEHKVFVQSVIWEINPFDQFGVELGKRIALELHQALQQEGEETIEETVEESVYDSSTAGLLSRIRLHNREKQR